MLCLLLGTYGCESIVRRIYQHGEREDDATINRLTLTDFLSMFYDIVALRRASTLPTVSLGEKQVTRCNEEQSDRPIQELIAMRNDCSGGRTRPSKCVQNATVEI